VTVSPAIVESLREHRQRQSGRRLLAGSEWQDFDLVLTVLIPLFLFSGTFYPLDVYPATIRVLVELTPLYHGVHLIRALTTGTPAPSLLLDVAYLVALSVAALSLATARLHRLLLK